MSAAHWREAIMRALTIIVAVAAVVECSPAMAQTMTPNVVTPAPRLQTPLTFTTTTCIMNCNSQVAASSNEMLRSGDARSSSLASVRLRYCLHNRLYLNTAGMPERMRSELPFALGSCTLNFIDQRRIVGVGLDAFLTLGEPN